MKEINKEYPQTIGEDYGYLITLEKDENGILWFKFKDSKEFEIIRKTFIFKPNHLVIKIIEEYENELLNNKGGKMNIINIDSNDREKLFLFDFDGVLTNEDFFKVFKETCKNEDTLIVSSRDNTKENFEEIKLSTGLDESKIFLCGGFTNKLHKIKEIHDTNDDKFIIHFDDDVTVKNFFDNFKYNNLEVKIV